MPRPPQALPSDVEAEQAVLGAVLSYPELAAVVLTKLRVDDFQRGLHRQLFDLCTKLFAQGKATDVLTVRTASRDARLDVDPLDLHELSQALPVPTETAVLGYVDELRSVGRRRRMILAANEVMHRAQTPGMDPSEAVDELLAQLVEPDTSDTTSLADMAVQALTDLEEIVARGPGLTGLATGFVDLDRVLNGLKPGNMCVLAARPGVGKTSLALNIARNVALEGGYVVFFSLEMSAWEIGMRLMCAEAGIDYSRVAAGNVHDPEWKAFVGASDRLSAQHMHVVDAAALNVLEVRTRMRQLAAFRKPNLVVVDYLQLMSGTRVADGRQVEVSEISRGMKLAAKELGVPVIAVSQLNRQLENRKDKTPQLSDLRESGSLEQDADIVLMLAGDDEDPNIVRCLVSKHRNGPTGSVDLLWHPSLMMFRSRTRRPDDRWTGGGERWPA